MVVLRGLPEQPPPTTQIVEGLAESPEIDGPVVSAGGGTGVGGRGVGLGGRGVTVAGTGLGRTVILTCCRVEPPQPVAVKV